MNILLDTQIFLWAISLPVRVSHFEEPEKLPPIHRDPFDRILVAQAMAKKMPILTADSALSRYDVDCL